MSFQEGLGEVAEQKNQDDQVANQGGLWRNRNWILDEDTYLRGETSCRGSEGSQER